MFGRYSPRADLNIRSIKVRNLQIADGGVFTNLGGVGATFYVSSVTGTDSTAMDGLSVAEAFATIDYAIGKCTANKGDAIIVMPGHVDTVSAAGGVTVDVAGISIIGIGNGHLRPKINFTTAVGASLDVTAANVLLENLFFNSAIDDQTALVNITAASVTIRGCEFLIADATVDAECGILASSAADRLTIEDCKIHSTGASTAITGGAISFAACDDTLIRNNEISGYFSTVGAIANTAAAENVNIVGNLLVNRSADANNKAIVLHSSTVGLISGNRLAVIDSTSPAPVTAAAAFVSGNYFTGAVGVSASTLM